jgi:hypothetical protein
LCVCECVCVCVCVCVWVCGCIWVCVNVYINQEIVQAWSDCLRESRLKGGKVAWATQKARQNFDCQKQWEFCELDQLIWYTNSNGVFGATELCRMHWSRATFYVACKLVAFLYLRRMSLCRRHVKFSINDTKVALYSKCHSVTCTLN